MALAVGAGWWLATKRAPAYGIAYEQVDRILLLLIAGGFIGARLYHVVSSWQYYVAHPLDALKVWHGGLSIFGALFGGLIVLLFVVYRRKSFSSPKLLFVLDWLAPSVLLGQIIGRFGNLFNYELYGLPTDLPWKMFVPQTSQKSLFEVAQFYFHPLFLYESLAGLLILLVLIRYNDLSKKFGLVNSPGILFCIWLILYGITRLFIEQLRIQHSYIGDFSVNFIIGAGMVIVGLVFYIKKY
jgi:phosphatidylglycerol:prolipoprotein diacylglycerol transferase